MSLLFKEESYAIVGAAYEVFKHLRSGFTEYVYQDALEHEFKLRGIPYEREKRLTVSYKGVVLEHDYFADFVCYGNIIVELKAVSDLLDIHCAQVGNYLNATNNKLGILLNFGVEDGLQTERILR